MDFFLSEALVPEDAPRIGNFPPLRQEAIYAQAVNAVVDFCQNNSICCWRTVEPHDYSEIERRIRRSKVLVAVIDRVWASGTSKCHEFTFACGWGSQINKSDPGPLLHRIVFLVKDLEYPNWLLNNCPEPFEVVRTLEELEVALQKCLDSSG